MKNYIEKNYKWLIRIFIIIWIFLILKLWYFWVYWICGWGGWYINLCIIPTYKYFWTNAWYISMAFLLLSILLIIWIYFIKNKILKVLLAFIILFLWIIGKPLFYYLSPDFKFYYTDEYLSYMDKEFHPKDVDLYLEYMWKYCNETKDDFNYKNLWRDSMCGWKYLYDFETVEDYKKVFDFANKNNMRELYRLTFIWAQDFWLEKIIKGYRDDTFYGYMIFNWNLDKDQREYLNNFLNLELKNIVIYYNNASKIAIEELLKNKNFNSYTYWQNFDKIFYRKLKQIKSVNTKVF